MIKNKDYRNQMQWAKETFIGQAFVNKKTGKVYYVKGITIDTETSELRIVYNDGINLENDWDRPLWLFMEKFELKNTGGNYER